MNTATCLDFVDKVHFMGKGVAQPAIQSLFPAPQVCQRACPMAAIAQPPRMPPAEKVLARKLHFDQGKTPADIARLLQRSASTIGRLLAQERAPKAVGRPKALSEKKVDRLVKLLNTFGG